jgi:hypothetical protein
MRELVPQSPWCDFDRTPPDLSLCVLRVTVRAARAAAARRSRLSDAGRIGSAYGIRSLRTPAFLSEQNQRLHLLTLMHDVPEMCPFDKMMDFCLLAVEGLMPLKPDSRELVDLRFAKVAEDISRAHRKEMDRIRQTYPRGGAMQGELDQHIVDSVKEQAEALVRIYGEAFEADGTIPSDADIDGIVRRVDEMVRGAKSNPVSRMLVSSRTKFETISGAARRDLLIIKSRLEIEARRQVESLPSKEPKPARPSLPERSHIEDIDSFERVREVNAGSVADLLNDGFLDVSEDAVQTAFEAILGVPMHKRIGAARLTICTRRI